MVKKKGRRQSDPARQVFEITMHIVQVSILECYSTLERVHLFAFNVINLTFDNLIILTLFLLLTPVLCNSSAMPRFQGIYFWNLSRDECESTDDEGTTEQENQTSCPHTGTYIDLY